jgi:hypothetical protein
MNERAMKQQAIEGNYAKNDNNEIKNKKLVRPWEAKINEYVKRMANRMNHRRTNEIQ